MIIGQLFRRQPWTSVEGYNGNVVTINKNLEARLAECNNIHFWKHRGFWNSLDFLAEDGVHLNDVSDMYMNR